MVTKGSPDVHCIHAQAQPGNFGVCPEGRSASGDSYDLKAASTLEILSGAGVEQDEPPLEILSVEGIKAKGIPKG